MGGMDRRRLLAGAAGVATAAAWARVAWAAAPPPPASLQSGAPRIPLRPLQAWATLSPPPPAPIAKLTPAVDVYFGDRVTDPYRWMENDKDPDWLPYLRGQNAHARAVLDAIPGRDALLTRIQALSGDITLTSQIQRAGGKLFYQQRRSGTDNFKLFVRESGRDRVLVDPTALSTAEHHMSLDWWRASPDGSHIVYGLSKDGSEDSLLHVKVTADGRDLAETIPQTQNAEPRWLNDGSGFFYNQLVNPVGAPERFLDSQAKFHRLGTDPASDPLMMKRGLAPAIAYDRIQAPYVITTEGSPYAALVLRDVRPEGRLYIAPASEAAAGGARWVEVAKFEDEVTDFELDGEDLYLVANKGTPRGRVLKTSLKAPSLATATEVVGQGPAVIETLVAARDALYLRIMDGGVARLRRLGRDGRVSEIALPFDGSIGGIAASPREDGLLMNYGGWLSPTGVWSVSAAGQVADTGLTPKPAIEVGGYETFRGFATAKDGTRIPYNLIYRKGLKRDGRTPAWIQAYGSYGASAYTPNFVGKALALIDAGFIVGFANVRGGGEYGREWHKAGQHALKPNTWRDLIAVCETLCKDGWTAPARLCIGGRSAGGITMGMAMNERPDLFAAVIDGVGWSNPLRYVMEQESFTEEPEWGAIADPEGYRWLKAIDSYQHVKDGTPYPAVLLTTGVTDPRVAPFHVAKMTARLQVASSSGKPILLRVDFDAGHGIGSTRAQQDREAADTYAFLLWRTGVPAYQPA